MLDRTEHIHCGFNLIIITYTTVCIITGYFEQTLLLYHFSITISANDNERDSRLRYRLMCLMREKDFSLITKELCGSRLSIEIILHCWRDNLINFIQDNKNPITNTKGA